MKKLYAIGETLIDFAPTEVNKGIAEVSGFEPHVGGAPLNVLGAYRLLGGESVMLTKLGEDPFGDKIVALMEDYGIDTSHVTRTTEANTSLAFVALQADGNREFSFYRKPGADMLYSAKDVAAVDFHDGYALHFCSVSLGDYPMKEAHKAAIQKAQDAGLIISFDPNVRLNLWESPEALHDAIHEFLPYADILKISDEEMEFITGFADPDQGTKWLFDSFENVKLIIFTEGKNGQRAYTSSVCAIDHTVGDHAVDTTGAGDAFIGSFLASLSEKGVSREDLATLTEGELVSMLAFSGIYAGDSITKAGGITSYATREEILG